MGKLAGTRSRGCSWREGTSRTAANQAELLVYEMKRPQVALPLAEEADRLFRECGLVDLAEEQIKVILDRIRAML